MASFFLFLSNSTTTSEEQHETCFTNGALSRNSRMSSIQQFPLISNKYTSRRSCCSTGTPIFPPLLFSGKTRPVNACYWGSMQLFPPLDPLIFAKKSFAYSPFGGAIPWHSGGVWAELLYIDKWLWTLAALLLILCCCCSWLFFFVGINSHSLSFSLSLFPFAYGPNLLCTLRHSLLSQIFFFFLLPKQQVKKVSC